MSEQQVNIFEQASRLKLRYQTSKGLVSTEDLWDLALTSLDELAKSLNKQVKELAEESFIEVKSTANEKLELAFEVVKHVIRVKLAEKQERELAKEKAAKRQQIMELINQKKNEQLSQMNVADLENMLETL